MPRQLADAGLPMISSLPSAAEDPVERRRLLNILAQRRYRNRKKARLESLELRVKESPVTTLDGASWPETEFQSQSFNGATPDTDLESTNLQPFLALAASSNNYGLETSQAVLYDPFSVDGSLFPIPDGSTAAFAQPQPASSISATLEDLDENNTSSEESSYAAAYTTSNQVLDQVWDSFPADATNATTTTTDSLSFNDEAFITTPGLGVIRAHVTILQHMHRNGSQIDVWNPFSISPFNTTSPPPLQDLLLNLPANYHPTPLQKAINHHPVLDLLPWPSVRSRILHILTLPQEVRPQRAKGDMPSVTMQLMFDIKDAGGGLRVWGSNPFDEDSWEVGPVFFQKWWWALNSDIVKRSNQIRTQRGEDILRLRDVSS